MRKSILASTLLFFLSCSRDPPGWTLWQHTFRTEEDETISDDWWSEDSYSRLEECKAQLGKEVVRLGNIYKNDTSRDPDFKFTLDTEKDVVKLSAVPLKANEKPKLSVTRWFCLPIGMDPRVKDQSTWVLWEERFESNGVSWSPRDGSSQKQFAKESHTH